MNTILKLFGKIECTRDRLVDYGNRSWWHSRIALLGICCLWFFSRVVYLAYRFIKLPQGRIATKAVASVLAAIMIANTGSMGYIYAYANDAAPPSSIVDVVSEPQASVPKEETLPTEELTTPPTEELTTPPTEVPSTPPTEEPATPPTEVPTTPPTEEPTTPPTEEPATPPTEVPTTPPTEVPATPPTEVPTTPPIEESTTPSTEPPCACPTVDSGEMAHTEDCSLYESAKPAVPEQSEAVKAVLALIDALPTMDELAEVGTEGEGFADYLAQLRLDTAAARSAFDALADEEKATLDTAMLAKLTELEGVLAVKPVVMSGAAITIKINDAPTEHGGATLQAAIDTAKGAGAYSSITKLTITKGEVTADDWAWFKGGIKANKSVLTNLTDFTVENAVTSVADLPAGQVSGTYFPGSIKTVSIPQAAAIGERAFEGSSKLETADFPMVTTIGEAAFYGCKLTAANFPKVISIEKNAFQSCVSLTSASFLVAEAIGEYAFESCALLATASFPAVADIGDASFKNCTSLVTLKLGAAVPTVTVIGAFFKCPKTTLTLVDADGNPLTESTNPKLSVIAANYDKVVSPDTGTAIDGLWYGWAINVPVAPKITIKINNADTEYGGADLSAAVTAALNGADVSTITKLTITKGEVTTADWAWFAGGTPGTSTPVLTNLTGFTVDASIADGKVAAIPNGYVNKPIFPTTIVAVTIPQTIAIGTHAFFGCSKLTTATIPNATSIGTAAFYGCTVLTTASFPAVTSIEAYVFYECKALETASFPAVTSIGENSFYNCKALETASFPVVTSIGVNAFAYCSKLATLKLGAGVPTVGADAFDSCPKTTLTLIDASGNELTSETLATAQAAYDAVADGMFTTTATDGLWYGWKVREPVVTCTCTLSAPTFTGSNVTIPADQPSTTYALAATGSVQSGDCKVLGHKDTTVTYSFAEKTDTGNIASVTGTTLTVTGAGSVVITATAAANGKTATKDATFTVTKATASTDKITVKINDAETEYGGASLSAAVTASDVTVANITKLTITGGEVTAADWTWFKGGTTNAPVLTYLTDFTIDAAVTSVADIPNARVGDKIFCEKIATVSIPQAIKIGDYAFNNCKKLTKAIIPAAKSIGNSAFTGCVLLESANFPAATSIGNYAFDSCRVMKTITFPMVETMGGFAFANCTALETISFPKITEIKESAFRGCVLLESASFPAVTRIVQTAFSECIKFAALQLPAAPPSTSGTAFYNCPTPRNLTLVDTSGNELAGTDLTTAHTNYDKVSDGESGSTTTDGLWFGWKVREPVAESKITIKINDSTTEIGGASLQAAVMAVTASGVTIANIKKLTITKGEVTAEDWNWFKSLTALTDFTITAAPTVTSVAEITAKNGTAAVFPTSIVTVSIPQAIAIGKNPFYECPKLTSVNFPAVTSIGEQAFIKCPKLTIVSFPAVTSIGKAAFSGCTTLTAASFPAATNIEAGAFNNCTSLATLKLGATPPTVGTDAFHDCPKTTLTLVDASGNALTDAALTTAQAAYTAASDGNTADDLWYGWTIGGGSVTPPTCTCTLDSLSAPDGGYGATETTFVTQSVATSKFPFAYMFNAQGGYPSGNCQVVGHPETITYSYALISQTPANNVTVTNDNADIPATISFAAVGNATVKCTASANGKTKEFTATLTVTQKATSPANGGKLEATLDQDKVDAVFGEGNATLDDTITPPTIKLEKDITPENPIEIETDVTIDLGGNTITGKPGKTPIIVGDNDKVTIDGSGTIAGGDSTTGTGGNGITGGTGSDITIGKDVIVSGGDSTTGTGGNGITGGTGSNIAIGTDVTVSGGDGTSGGDGINSGGNVIVNGGTVTGGTGSGDNGGDGVDTSGNGVNGDITVDGGTVTGGSSTGGGGSGGNGIISDKGDIVVNNGGTATGGNGNGDGSGGVGSGSNGSGSITVGGGTTGGTGSTGSSTGGNGGTGSADGGNGGTGSTTGGTTEINSGGTVTGGNGGNGSTTGGNGGNGTSGNVTVDSGGTTTGGAGGSGSATGGDGGDGASGNSSITINGGATGGNGGNGSTTGGNGGNGTNTGGGAITVGNGGTATGGSGGTGTSGTGGTGGNGANVGGAGSVAVGSGGTTTGGSGGTGSTAGGTGGNGTSSGTTTINGGATGGNGGNGNVNGNGGTGGDGAHQDNGTVSGSGTATGGDGGNGAGTGAGGDGGTGVGGGAGAGTVTTKSGVNGRKATAEVDYSKSGTTVTVPDESKLADAALTEDEKKDIAITEVKVVLNVEKKNNQPDKAEVDSVINQPSVVADTIGAFFDITLNKIITNAGGAQPSTSVATASEEIEITITIPSDMRGGSDYVVIRVHNGTGDTLTTTRSGDDLTFKTDKFSTYAIAYTKNTTPLTPPPSPSGGSSSDSDEYDFWMTVGDKIQKANRVDVIKVSAKHYDKMPASVMRALYKSGVGMVITWDGGKTITIPTGKAAKQEAGRIYYPLSLLAQMYKGFEFVETPTGISWLNPETGGGYIAYADGKQVPVIGGVAQLEAPAAPAITAEHGAALKAPPAITPPTAGFEADAFAGTEDAKAARGMGTAAIAGFAMLLAALCGGGVWFWKRRTDKSS